MAKYGTRVHAAWDALFELMSVQAWPADLTGSTPKVLFAGESPDTAFDNPTPIEAVVVVAMVDEGQASWATLGRPGVDEEIPFTIVVSTAIPGRSGRQVNARLAELVATVEASLRDADTGAPIPLDVECVAQPGPLVVQVAPTIEAGPEGAIGVAEVRIVTRFRI